MKTDSFSSLIKKKCKCPITLMYHDKYAQANHFNLLLPRGYCCSAPVPENTASSVSIDLENGGNSYAKAVKQMSQTHPSFKPRLIKSTESKQPGQGLTSLSTKTLSSNSKTIAEKPTQSSEALSRRLTLPVGQKILNPFQMASLTNDFSQLPPSGLMDIFNHQIMSKTDYDKSKLSSWRSFEEYNLCTNGHVQSLGVNTTEDLDGSTFLCL